MFSKEQLQNLTKDDLIKIQAEIMSRDFYEFVKRAWRQVDTQKYIETEHVRVICNVLQLVAEHKVQNLIINIPPGHGKTIIVSILFPVWLWTRDAQDTFLFSTYAQSLSNSIAKRSRQLIKSNWYQARWGTKVNFETDEATKSIKTIMNSAGGWRVSTSKGSDITGRRAHYIIFDDLNKVQDVASRVSTTSEEIAKTVEFFKDTLYNRQIETDDKTRKTKIIGIAQRLHAEDVSQFCIKQHFLHVNFALIADRSSRLLIIYNKKTEEYYTRRGDYKLLTDEIIWYEDCRADGEILCRAVKTDAEVIKLQQIMSPLQFSAQYQQEPVLASGNIFNIDNFIINDTPQILDNCEYAISIDASFSNNKNSDYTVIQIWSVTRAVTNQYSLLKTYREQASFTRLVEMTSAAIDFIKTIAGGTVPVKILIEKAANGWSLIDLLSKARLPAATVVPIVARVNKVGRWEGANSAVARGSVQILRDPILIKEIISVPLSKNDDQVDAMSQLILHYELAHTNIQSRLTATTRALRELY